MTRIRGIVHYFLLLLTFCVSTFPLLRSLIWFHLLSLCSRNVCPKVYLSLVKLLSISIRLSFKKLILFFCTLFVSPLLKCKRKNIRLGEKDSAPNDSKFPVIKYLVSYRRFVFG